MCAHKALDYFQTSVINIGSASLGAVCYELKERNASDVSNLLLSSDAANTTTITSKPHWTCREFPVSLLVELMLISNINKLVIQTDKYAPQIILVQYSLTGKNNDFQTLATIFDMHKVKNNCIVVV